MKLKNLKITLFLIILSSISACKDGVEQVTSPSDASLISLTFTANASNPNVGKAVFTIDTSNGTVYNVDSLPYLTKIDSVIPNFKFTSTSSSYIYFGADSVALDGKDTINFSVPVVVRNFSADKSNFKQYEIKVNVHTVNPELYQWSQRSTNIHVGAVNSQKAIAFNDSIFYFLNDGTSAHLYASTDGISWKSIPINGLPVNTPLTDLTVFNNKLYLSQNGDKLYSATHPSNWSIQSLAEYNFSSLVVGLNNRLWAIVQSKSDLNNYYYASSTTGAVWEVHTSSDFPTNFPIRDFAVLSFSSRTNKAKAMLLGGVSKTGNTLYTNWNTEDGKNWFNFSSENDDLNGLMPNASVIVYDNKLLLYSDGISENPDNNLYESKDEGFTWQMVDTTHNAIPYADSLSIGLRNRTKQSVLVLKPKNYSNLDSKESIQSSNRIFIIGGKQENITLTDCWTGKLNRKNFLKQ
jgi:hypothetical protein